MFDLFFVVLASVLVGAIVATVVVVGWSIAGEIERMTS